jgi:hypothetical protein
MNISVRIMSVIGRNFVRRAILGVALLAAFTLAAQEGHPLVGTWHGDWGPRPQDRTDVTFVIQWDGKTISGIINPGLDAMKIENATLDVNGWKVHFEANAKGTRVIVDGTLQDITSVRRSIVGTWTQGAVKGDFKIRRDN